MKEKKEAPSEKLKTLTNKILWFRNHFSTAMDLTQPLTVGNTEFKKRVEEIKDFFEYLEKLKDDFNELKKEFIEIVKPNITDEELHNGIKEQIRLKEWLIEFYDTAINKDRYCDDIENSIKDCRLYHLELLRKFSEEPLVKKTLFKIKTELEEYMYQTKNITHINVYREFLIKSNKLDETILIKKIELKKQEREKENTND